MMRGKGVTLIAACSEPWTLKPSKPSQPQIVERLSLLGVLKNSRGSRIPKTFWEPGRAAISLSARYAKVSYELQL